MEDLRLTDDELYLLKQLKVAGELGRTVTAVRTQERLDRLRRFGYITGEERRGKGTLYRITRTGSDAVSLATL